MIVTRKKFDSELKRLKEQYEELEAENNRLYILIEHILKRKKDGALGRLIVDLIEHSEKTSGQLVETKRRLKEVESADMWRKRRPV